MSTPDNITLHFKAGEIETLIRLLFLGSFVQSVQRKELLNIEKEPVIQTIYEAAHRAQLQPEIQYIAGTRLYSTTADYKVDLFDEVIAGYNNDVFVERMGTYLTERKMERKYGAFRLMHMKEDERLAQTMHLHMEYEDKIRRNFKEFIEYMARFFDVNSN